MATEKQIFAAVEAADHEIRLIVGEFFNTRFNIIKVERVPVSSISYDKVTDPEAVTKAVRTAAENAKKMISAEVQRVILAIPSFRAKRYSFKSTVDVEGIDGLSVPGVGGYVHLVDLLGHVDLSYGLDEGEHYVHARLEVCRDDFSEPVFYADGSFVYYRERR